MDTILLVGCVLCIVGGVSAQVTSPAVCPAKKWGVNCALDCSPQCKTGICDINNGICAAGCNPGWTPSDPTCKTECTAGLYGENCGTQCGQCQGGNAKCNKVTGRCADGCSPGFTGDTCHQECAAGSYGAQCQQRCGHCQPQRRNGPTVCHHITGECKDCLPGFQLPNCTIDCQGGTWGVNCMRLCSDNCQNSRTCNTKTGHCTCKPGYDPSDCDDNCQPGYYGQDCKSQCGECQGGCDHVTGECNQCKDNRQMPMCKECVSGQYGGTCSQRCGRCGGDGGCDRATGVCLSPVCLPGYAKTPKCNTRCSAGTYGQDCNRTCGHCGNNSPCRHDNGVCEQDCEEGYEGVLCQRQRDSLVVPVVVAVLGAGALIAIAIVASVCYMKRNTKFKPISTSKEDFTDMAEIPNHDDDPEAPETPGTPGTPQVSDVYQNVQVNHDGGLHADPTPASNYDRVDMAVKPEDVHHYESHNALKAAAAASPPLPPQEDPLYQNTFDVIGQPGNGLDNKMAPPPPLEEPEATYGNL